MKQSILLRTFIIILVTIIMVLFISWVITNYLADDIYEHQKLKQIKDSSKKIQQILQESQNDEEATARLKILSIDTGTSIYIFNENNEPIYADYLMRRHRGEGEKVFLKISSKLRVVLPQVIFKIKNGESDVIKYTSIVDKKVHLLYAERHENGMLTSIQIPMERIDETVNIFKGIIKYMIIAALVFGSIGAYVLSKNITKPLVELKDIAIQMGKLDFSYKYKGSREDEIGQLGKTLNQMSQELEKTIEQLKSELKKEKTLDALRKQFVAQVSHEIQTPLAIIQGYIEVLEDGLVESQEDAKYHYEVINDEINKMVMMLRDLLDLSQLEAGTFMIKRKKFNLTDLIESMSDKYSEIAKKNNIQWCDHYDKSRNIVLGDIFRLEQVLSNYIKNAFEHTHKEGKIIISTERKNQSIRVSIENTGNNIPKEDQPYIWESFYKSKNSSQQKGTGLGLAISKHILNLHNAKYGADNLKEGVVFWFEMTLEE